MSIITATGLRNIAATDASALDLVAADDAQDERSGECELHLPLRIAPPEIGGTPAEQGDKHGNCNADDHAVLRAPDVTSGIDRKCAQQGKQRVKTVSYTHLTLPTSDLV